MMPDAELSVVGECVTQETPIVGGTGEGYGLLLNFSIDNGVYTTAEVACSGIEIDATQVIADRIQLMITLWQGAGSTEIERTAVGRENRISLIDRFLLEKGRKNQLVFLDVVDLKVGGLIKDLNTIAVGAMECLLCNVGRIGYITTRGMPVGIDTQAKRLICLSIVCSHRTITLTQQSGTVFASDMQAHIVRIAAVEAMAVDAPLELSILDECPFIKRGEVALVDAHFAPDLVTWRNQTIANTVVDAVRTNKDWKRAICMPSIVIFGGNSHAERVSTILSQQLMPVVKVEIDRFFPLAVKAVSVTVCNDSINKQSCLVNHTKIKRSYIYGYGDTEIVWIYLRLFLLLPRIADSLGSTGCEEEQK